jgi:hypothetical protein
MRRVICLARPVRSSQSTTTALRRNLAQLKANFRSACGQSGLVLSIALLILFGKSIEV